MGEDTKLKFNEIWDFHTEQIEINDGFGRLQAQLEAIVVGLKHLFDRVEAIETQLGNSPEKESK